MKVTIKDVAKQARVSQATVSLVMNEAPGVSASTREHVRRVMHELNYKPSALARNLSSRRAEAIALVMPVWQNGFDNPFFTHMLSGVLEAVRDRGYKMLLEVADDRFSWQKIWRDLFEHKRVDGMMIAMPMLHQEYLVELEASRYPALLLNDLRPDLPALDCIAYDNARGGFDATHYLIGLGHRRIAHVCGRSGFVSALQRREGFLRAMEQAGLPCVSEDILPGNFDLESGEAAFCALMNRPPRERPTAVFCANDLSALGFWRAARDAGVSVPGDISVIGLDDAAPPIPDAPPLTTMRQDANYIARFAADKFLEKLEGRQTTPIQESLIMERIERATCAPPRAA